MYTAQHSLNPLVQRRFRARCAVHCEFADVIQFDMTVAKSWFIAELSQYELRNQIHDRVISLMAVGRGTGSACEGGMGHEASSPVWSVIFTVSHTARMALAMRGVDIGKDWSALKMSEKTRFARVNM